MKYTYDEHACMYLWNAEKRFEDKNAVIKKRLSCWKFKWSRSCLVRYQDFKTSFGNLRNKIIQSYLVMSTLPKTSGTSICNADSA